MTKEASSGDCKAKANRSEHLSKSAGTAQDATVSNNSVVETLKSHSLQDTPHPVTSTPETAVPICGPPAVPAAVGIRPKTVTDVTPETAPSSQPIHPFPSVASSLQIASQCPPPGFVQPKRQGRKTAKREEPPRRRGRKPASLPPVSLDGSAGKETKDLNVHVQPGQLGDSSSKDIGLRGKTGTENQESTSVQNHAGGTQIVDTVHSQGLKRKEQAPKPAQHKQLLASSTKIDATGALDRTSVSGRYQTANINDVARVMKEVFSGTCLSKAKVGESSGNENKDAPAMPVLSKSSVEVTKNDKAEAISATILNSNIPIEAHEKESSVVASEIRPDSANALEESIIPKIDDRKSGSTKADKLVESRETSAGCSTVVSAVRSMPPCPLSTDQNKNDICQISNPDEGILGSSGDSISLVGSSRPSSCAKNRPTEVDTNSGDKYEVSLKEPLKSSVLKASGSAISSNFNNADHNPPESSSFGDSNASKVPEVMDNVSENETKPVGGGSLKSSPDRSSYEVPSSLKNDGVNHPAPILTIPSDSSHTNVITACTTQMDYKNMPELSLEEPPECPLDMSSVSHTTVTVAATTTVANARENAEISADQACPSEVSSDIGKKTLDDEKIPSVDCPTEPSSAITKKTLDNEKISPVYRLSEPSEFDNTSLECPATTSMPEMLNQSRIDYSPEKTGMDSGKDDNAKCSSEVAVEFIKTSSNTAPDLTVETLRTRPDGQDCPSVSPGTAGNTMMDETVSVCDEVKMKVDLRPVVIVETLTENPSQDCPSIPPVVIDTSSMNESVPNLEKSRQCSLENSGCQSLSSHHENQDHSNTAAPNLVEQTSGNKIELASEELPNFPSSDDGSVQVHEVSARSPDDSDIAKSGRGSAVQFNLLPPRVEVADCSFKADVEGQKTSVLNDNSNQIPEGNLNLPDNVEKIVEENAEFVNSEGIPVKNVPMPLIQDNEDNKADNHGACLMDMDISSSDNLDVPDAGGVITAGISPPTTEREKELESSNAVAQMDVSDRERVPEDKNDNMVLPSSSLQGGEENYSFTAVGDQVDSLGNREEPKKFGVNSDLQVNASQDDITMISENLVQENSNDTSVALQEGKIEGSAEINQGSPGEKKQSDPQVEDVLDLTEEDQSGNMAQPLSSSEVKETNVMMLPDTGLDNSGDQTDLPLSSSTVTDREKMGNSSKDDLCDCTVTDSVEALEDSGLLPKKMSEASVVLSSPNRNEDTSQMGPVSSPVSLEGPSDCQISSDHMVATQDNIVLSENTSSVSLVTEEDKLQSFSEKILSNSAEPLEDCKDSDNSNDKLDLTHVNKEQLLSITENPISNDPSNHLTVSKTSEASASDQSDVSQTGESVIVNAVDTLTQPPPLTTMVEEKSEASCDSDHARPPPLKDIPLQAETDPMDSSQPGEILEENISGETIVPSSPPVLEEVGDAIMQSVAEVQTIDQTDASKVCPPHPIQNKLINKKIVTLQCHCHLRHR